jgi:RNA polymerase sigma-70 factor, ECF subfamily
VNRPATSAAKFQPRGNEVGFLQPSTALDIAPDFGAEIHRGHKGTLEFLISQYLPSLRRIARRHLSDHVRSSVDADDVVQDALVSTLRRLPHFVSHHPGALLAYLRRAICNRIIDVKRKSARQGEWIALPDDCAAQASSPLQRIIDKEDMRRYRAALRRLKPRDRRLILMRVEQQLPFQEIGRQLHLTSPNAARVALVRALNRLVSALEHV